MFNFKIKVAEITVEINAIFETTKKFCENYLTESEPDFSLEITEEDIKFEREKSRQNDIKNGKDIAKFSDSYLETLAVYRKIAEQLPFFDAFLLHGSAVSVDDKGYIFTAKSGTGKSTHTNLYRVNFGDRVVVVNDDKPIIRILDNKVYVCGTPWSGKSNLDNNIMVELKGLCALKRGADNEIYEITAAEILEVVLSQSYRPQKIDNMSRFLSVLSVFLEKVRVYELSCNTDPTAATVSFNGMNK